MLRALLLVLALSAFALGHDEQRPPSPPKVPKVPPVRYSPKWVTTKNWHPRTKEPKIPPLTRASTNTWASYTPSVLGSTTTTTSTSSTSSATSTSSTTDTVLPTAPPTQVPDCTPLGCQAQSFAICGFGAWLQKCRGDFVRGCVARCVSTTTTTTSTESTTSTTAPTASTTTTTASSSTFATTAPCGDSACRVESFKSCGVGLFKASCRKKCYENCMQRCGITTTTKPTTSRQTRQTRTRQTRTRETGTRQTSATETRTRRTRTRRTRTQRTSGSNQGWTTTTTGSTAATTQGTTPPGTDLCNDNTCRVTSYSLCGVGEKFAKCRACVFQECRKCPPPKPCTEGSCWLEASRLCGSSSDAHNCRFTTLNQCMARCAVTSATAATSAATVASTVTNTVPPSQCNVEEIAKRCGNSCEVDRRGVCLASCNRARRANPNLGSCTECPKLCPAQDCSLDSCMSQCVTSRRIDNGCVTFITQPPTISTAAATTTANPCIRQADTTECSTRCVSEGNTGAKLDECVDVCLTRRIMERGCSASTAAATTTTTTAVISTVPGATTTVSSACEVAGRNDIDHCTKFCKYSGEKIVGGLTNCVYGCVCRRRRERGCPTGDTTTLASTITTSLVTQRQTTRTTRAPRTTSATCVDPTDASVCFRSCSSSYGAERSLDSCVDTCMEQRLRKRGCLVTKRPTGSSSTTAAASSTTTNDACFKASDATFCGNSCANSYNARACVTDCTKRRYEQRGCQVTTAAPATTTAPGDCLKPKDVQDCKKECNGDSENCLNSCLDGKSLARGCTRTTTTAVTTTTKAPTTTTATTTVTTTMPPKMCNTPADKVTCGANCYGSLTCERDCLKRCEKPCEQVTVTTVNWRTKAPTCAPTPENGERLCKEELAKCVTAFSKCTHLSCSRKLVKTCLGSLMRVRKLIKNSSSVPPAQKTRNSRVKNEIVCMLSTMQMTCTRHEKVRTYRTERLLRKCKRLSCRVRFTRRLALTRRRWTEQKSIAVRALLVGADTSKCRRQLERVVLRARKFEKTVVSVCKWTVKREFGELKTARKRLYLCIDEDKLCTRRWKREVRRIKRQIRRAKKVVRRCKEASRDIVKRVKAAMKKNRADKEFVHHCKVALLALSGKAVAKRLVAVAYVIRRLKVMIHRLKQKASIKLEDRFFKGIQMLVHAIHQCKTGRCIALVSRQASRLIRRARTAAHASWVRQKTSIVIIGVRMKKYSEATTNVTVAAVRASKRLPSTSANKRCRIQLQKLQAKVAIHQLQRKLCGPKEYNCLHAHSSQIHSGRADIAALRDCDGTKKEPKLTGAAAVLRDQCDDAVADWHADRERLNRRLAGEYDAAAKCDTVMCTKTSLTALKKLHLELGKLQRPACAKIYVDSNAVPTTTTTTVYGVTASPTTTSKTTAKKTHDPADILEVVSDEETLKPKKWGIRKRFSYQPKL